MRRAVLMAIIAMYGGLILVSLMWMERAGFSEATAFVLPDAADVEIERSSLSRQHITYHLPLSRIPDDLYEELTQIGWTGPVRIRVYSDL